MELAAGDAPVLGADLEPAGGRVDLRGEVAHLGHVVEAGELRQEGSSRQGIEVAPPVAVATRDGADGAVDRLGGGLADFEGWYGHGSSSGSWWMWPPYRRALG